MNEQVQVRVCAAWKAGDPETPKDLPKQNELNEMVARQCLIVFDFFSCAMMGNERSVRI